MAEQPPQPDWSTVLPELLQSIGKRLASSHDAASFRSVCLPWRDAIPFNKFAPLLLLPFGPDSESLSFYSVSEEKEISLPLPDDMRGKVPCGASRGWLALMDEAASVTLLNPFTGARVELPPADERIAAASSTRVSKVDGRWVLHPDDRYWNAGAARFIKLEEMRDVFIREIVLSAPPYAGHARVAIAVLANSTQIALCRVGVDGAWTLLDTNLECSVDCIVPCQEKIIAIDITGDVSICTYNDEAGATPTATPLPSLSPPAELCNRSYLESNGELHLVGAMVKILHGIHRFTYSVKVYKCDFLLDQTPVWSKVNDVGDLTLLVSKNFNENFSGESVSEYKRNSIYLSEALYGDPTDLEHCYEVVDIPTEISDVVPFREKIEQSESLCWFRPNIWMGGAL